MALRPIKKTFLEKMKEDAGMSKPNKYADKVWIVIIQDQLSQGCYMPIAASKQIWVTQKYAIKSHLTSLLSSRSHSTIVISVYCKNCDNRCLSARH